MSKKTYQDLPLRVYTSIKILKMNVAIFTEIYVSDIELNSFRSQQWILQLTSSYNPTLPSEHHNNKPKIFTSRG